MATSVGFARPSLNLVASTSAAPRHLLPCLASLPPFPFGAGFKHTFRSTRTLGYGIRTTGRFLQIRAESRPLAFETDAFNTRSVETDSFFSSNIAQSIAQMLNRALVAAFACLAMFEASRQRMVHMLRISGDKLSEKNASELKKQLLQSVGPLFFAASSQGVVSTPLTVVASGMARWLELYSGVMMIRVLLSWFPNIPWDRQPFVAIRDMCDPYLNLFRNLVPPVFNALDLSPMLAFMVLGTLASILNGVARPG